MNILIVTHNLNCYSGSDLLTSELSLALKRKGNNVTIFAINQGQLAELLNENGIRVVKSLFDVRNDNFDFIHAQHNITAIIARAYFPDTPIVFMALGVLPLLEQPPSININISKFIAVSEEVQKNLINRGVKSKDITIVRNWANMSLFKPGKIITTVKSVLVISNHFEGKFRKVVEKTCFKNKLKLTHIGLPDNSVPNEKVPELIMQHDIVITLGRGVIETLSCGKNAIIYDINGFDGLVTLSNYKKLRACNFSGRALNLPCDPSILWSEIKNSQKNNIVELSKLVRREHSLEKGIEDLMTIYKDLRKQKEPFISSNDIYNALSFVVKDCNNRSENAKDSIAILSRIIKYARGK